MMKRTNDKRRKSKDSHTAKVEGVPYSTPAVFYITPKTPAMGGRIRCGEA